MRQDTNQGGNDVRVYGCRIGPVLPIAFRSLLLSIPIIAELPESAEQVSAQLSRDI